MSDISRNQIVDFLREKVGQRTGVPAAEITGDSILGEIGVRSIDAVLICGMVEDEFALEIDPMLMFQYRTINEVTDRIMDMLSAQ